jgi:hypothetical protein
MKVAELIEILEGMDPDAEVLIGSAPAWPFEYAIAGVTTREDVLAETEDENDPVYEDNKAPSDVFLLEGEQLRYGSKLMWSAARR